ncbi:MAG: PilN domain-containing protein [bacterium]
MIEINLLPKEYLKKSLSFSLGKAGLYAIIGVAGVALMLIGITVYQIHQISSLEDNIESAQRRAAMLEKDIQLVDALTDVKYKITDRMTAVERLDSHRSSWVRILEDVARNVPEFVWLGHFKEEPLVDSAAIAGQAAGQSDSQQPATLSGEPTVRNAQVKGYSFTLNALASFMIKMMRSDYFENVELVSSDEVKFQDQKAYNFVLTCNLHYLSEESMRNLLAHSNSPGGTGNDRSGHRNLN